MTSAGMFALPTLLVLGVACGAPGDRATPGSPPVAIGGVVEGLCQLSAVPTDRKRARSVFFGRVHGALHEMAAAVEVEDRSAAARILEAKARVESDLDAPRLPPGFATDVLDLLGAVRESAPILGATVPACPT